MHIQSCENPKHIINPYTGESMYVPCGKCHTCRTSRSFRWVSRIEQERLCWPYSIFFTLTYNEKFVPSLYNDGEGNYLSNDYSLALTDDEIRTCDVKSRNYISRLDKLRILNVNDSKNFFKRLRYQISEAWKKEKGCLPCPSFRYVMCGEYGETTLRPHMHGILFFKEKFILDYAEELLNRAWSVYHRNDCTYESFGSVEFEPIASNASSYVAQYVNCFSNLPEVLTLPKVRPFFVSSRRPPIGSLFYSDEKIQKIFDKGLVEVRLPSENGEGFTSAALLPSFKDRLFPKCLRYNSLTFASRVTIYGLAQRLPKESEDAQGKDFEWFVRQWYKKFCETNTEAFLNQYIDEITTNFHDLRPLYRAFRISCRVLTQAKIFGVSLETYVRKIDLYYSNLEKSNLRKWYQFAEDYCQNGSHKDLLFVDIDFIEKFYNEPSKINPLIFKSYGLDTFTYLDTLDFRLTSDYVNMKFRSYKIYKDNCKTKKKNDYILAHPEKAIFVFH